MSKNATLKNIKNCLQYQLSLNAGQKYCRMLPLEHSAILSTLIKLPFVIKIFVLSFFEWPLKTGFNVLHKQVLLLYYPDCDNKRADQAVQMHRLVCAFFVANIPIAARTRNFILLVFAILGLYFDCVQSEHSFDFFFYFFTFHIGIA